MFAAGGVAAASGTHAFLITHAHAEPSTRTSLNRSILCSTLLLISMPLLLLRGHPQSHSLVVAGVGLLANLSCLVSYPVTLATRARSDSHPRFLEQFWALECIAASPRVFVDRVQRLRGGCLECGSVECGCARYRGGAAPETAAERGDTSQDPVEGWDLPKGWEGLEEGGREDDYPEEGGKGFLDGPGEDGTAVAVV
ncbi:hypothetical protein NSK_006194 [Nannochloropsis salina CCMP1776]|uniref:Uncharacterized protein n=1 Tax=Nannochloropsis salina CCMP1776 TaxID=1027361 RepID=A0A4D9CUE6_9STRA|nr:hypothetical protein NSK_006194 [Nannochloropsis salina CCMP1776]|eukprot:TFJ82516.1 hypothetical protein NSK_006194 [Nannochloropsis salina CCMP1776]